MFLLLSPISNPLLYLLENSTYVATGASRVNVDVLQVDGVPLLTVTDDGVGLNPDDMHHMFSFGFSSKPQIGFADRGFGFKSGSMRLGTDALVFTRDRATRRVGVGYLSRTFNENECEGSLKIPMVFWNPNGTLYTPEHEAGQALSIIIRLSPFKTPQALFGELRKLNNRSGVRIVICGLRHLNGTSELDFVSDMSDICVASEFGTLSLRTYSNVRFAEFGTTAVFVRDRVIPAHSKYNIVDLSRQLQSGVQI